MDVRIFVIGIAIGIVLSGGTSVLAISNSTGNNTNSDIGTAKELEKLTGNNSLTNLTTLTTFNQSGSNQTNQTSNQTGNNSGQYP
ncbi:MAG: hypothetical protein E6K94_11310 [Thaumarchaeota archaeon]|nr:MAG: hypothetical protein E6L03_03220 [Nitrososphaerota archaeon]TLX88092.1 MAG: hypothetical protein E6L01_00980 [Nitrososphaerota archaeon]TLX89013.1 MAG: hypothetical protein E6K94_11310 [Nitrososphaerota archaeon]